MIVDASPMLSLLFAKGLGVKTLSHIVECLVADGLSPAELLDLPTESLIDRYGLRPKIVDAIRDAEALAIETAAELEREGVEILIRGIDPYPAHLIDVLGDSAPPILFVRGDISILARRGVGFCGSRKASEKGIRITGESAEELAREGVNVVSGYAKGVDLAAHVGALHGQGATTIVLAEGILHFRRKREVKTLLSDDNHLVVSEFSPRLPWSGRNAMQRNRTIIGLSDAVVCIESGMTGGTFAAAETTLSLGLPLFVADYAQPSDAAAGNKHFIGLGATPLRGDRNGRPNLKRVFDVIGFEPAAPTENEVPTATGHEASTQAPIEENETEHMPESSPNELGGRQYPRRLIEVDLPIARISAHARREKSIRHGHISTLHIWWARRPLAACRAVLCASLWPDPADELCPQEFRNVAVEQIKAFANRVFPKKITPEGKLLSSEKHLSLESRGRWEAIAEGTLTLDPNEPVDMPILRLCLLDFIADFANWDNSSVKQYLETSRAITDAAHIALGGLPETRPLVIDPFAGGGSIPLEALRVGADAFASDLNPVPVLLNKVVQEYIPKYGERLAKQVLDSGLQIKAELQAKLRKYYPIDDGLTPIAYLWARTILCEGPNCGVEIPLMRTMWLARKGDFALALNLKCDSTGKRIDFSIIEQSANGWTEQQDPSVIVESPELGGTVQRGSATCPCCKYTTPVASVREQLSKRCGGATDARMLAVVLVHPNQKGRKFRLPNEHDTRAFDAASEELKRLEKLAFTNGEEFSRIPNEDISPNELRRISVPIYGMKKWGDLYSPRQALALSTLTNLIKELDVGDNKEFAIAVRTCLALNFGRVADLSNALCGWKLDVQCPTHLFARQAIGMVWDFSESVCLSESSGSWSVMVQRLAKVLLELGSDWNVGSVAKLSATNHVLPDDSVSAVVTDPPYYDAVPYAHLSDFFYVWQKRMLKHDHPDLFDTELVPKAKEIVVDRPHKLSKSKKGVEFYEAELQKAFAESRRVLQPNGIATIVFASKSTESWEAILNATVEAGWVITGSWPIDTEMETRVSAQGQARLASSVHLVCRPRETESGTSESAVGEWRDVLSELPKRIHEWMPRLTAEGVVGADAIFACLGPALEIYSRYSRVEKSNGEAASLREYLEFVWGAVSTEALSLIFKDADASGLEPDARLTAMWLWTLGGSANGKPDKESEDSKAKPSEGFTLEYDAARKIAQGLGVHLEECNSLVEIKADKAKLLPVNARTQHLFGKESSSSSRKTAKKAKQRTLFEELDEAEAEEEGWSKLKGPPPGSTTLDRVHQAMILFAANRGELLSRFLVEDGVGKDARFWKLADNLNKLYPIGTEERRWVEGLLARKKGLGL